MSLSLGFLQEEPRVNAAATAPEEGLEEPREEVQDADEDEHQEPEKVREPGKRCSLLPTSHQWFLIAVAMGL